MADSVDRGGGLRVRRVDAAVPEVSGESGRGSRLSDGRPGCLDRGSSRRVNISLDRGLLEVIDDEARQRHMTRSAFLATAARHREAALEEGFAGGHELDHGRAAGEEVLLDGADQARALHGGEQVSEEALLGLLEGGVGGGLRRGVQGLAVLHGAGGFQGRDDVCWWMMRKAPA